MDQTKTRGLTLALNSLDNVQKVLKALGGGTNVIQAYGHISLAIALINSEIEANQQQPTVFVGERRTK